MPPEAKAMIEALLAALRERDPYTYGHCQRVSRNAKLLAQAAGLTPREQYVVEISSVFHDLGKLAVPDAILLKPGRLTAEEHEIMRIHPIKGVEILKPLAHIPFFRSLLPGIRHHHERTDGLGYPDKIAGENIPLVARMILIADTFDAMTTTRPYRKGLPFEIAYKELQIFAGRQFDPQLVKIFCEAHPSWKEFETDITEEYIASKFKRVA